jgi:hypothetical protein
MNNLKKSDVETDKENVCPICGKSEDKRHEWDCKRNKFFIRYNEVLSQQEIAMLKKGK